MANILLGLTEETAITLPTLKWLGDNKPDLPVSVQRQVEEAIMSDHSSRWAYYPNSKKREFVWENGYITKANLNTIEALFDQNQALKYQNNNESTTWYNVIFISLDYGPVRSDILQLERYWCRIILREA